MKRVTFLTKQGNYINIPIDNFYISEVKTNQDNKEIWLCSCNVAEMDIRLDPNYTFESAVAVFDSVTR